MWKLNHARMAASTSEEDTFCILSKRIDRQPDSYEYSVLTFGTRRHQTTAPPALAAQKKEHERQSLFEGDIQQTIRVQIPSGTPTFGTTESIVPLLLI